MTAVILDTDIGTDIDDTWALALLLRCPELDLRLVTTVSGDTTYRARVAAGVLARADRSDVPIGIGLSTPLAAGVPAEPQGKFAAQVDLDGHGGGVHDDGVAALVDCIAHSDEPVTIISIGPLTNVAAALELEPGIAERATLIGMHGWLRDFRSPAGVSHPPAPEYNVVSDIAACRAAFEAPWRVTLTPIDSCGQVVLTGDRYRAIHDAGNPLTRVVLENYEEWAAAWGLSPETAAWFGDRAEDGPFWVYRSTILFDTVAVYLAYDESLLNIEPIALGISEDGLTHASPGSPEVRVATGWADLGAFEDHLVERLVRPPLRGAAL